MREASSGISENQFYKVMKEYKFDRFPRVLANPSQNWFRNIRQMYQFICVCEIMGRPAFTSTNSYMDFDKYGNPTNVNLNKILIDLDGDTGQPIEVALEELRRVVEWAEENKVSYVSSFSGTGFHFMPIFRDKVYTLDQNLSLAVKAMVGHLKKELNLKTVNMQCAEPKRLVRIPYSRYCPKCSGSERWELHDNYCIPLTSEIIHQLDYNSILSLSFTPPIYNCSLRSRGNKRYVKEFIKEFSINPREYVDFETGCFEGREWDFTTNVTADFLELMKLLIPFPCLVKALLSKNPPHTIRFSACSFLTNVLSEQEAQTFFDRLAFEAQWNDRMNNLERHKQVKSVYRVRYEPSKCKRYQEMGICFKSKDCERWIE